MGFRQFSFLLMAQLMLLATVFQAIGADFTSRPEDVTSEVGHHEVTFSCRLEGNAPDLMVEWRVFTGNTGIRIYFWNGQTNDNKNPAKYDVIGEGNFDLKIKNLDLSDGSMYACIDMKAGADATAHLVVLEKPEIDSTELYENETANITCMARYGSKPDEDLATGQVPQIEAFLGGHKLYGTEVRHQNESFSTLQLLLNFTTEVEDNNRELKCRIITNTPLHETWNSTLLDVQYSVRDIEIFPQNPGRVGINDIITCNASGNPAPTLLWQPFKSAEDRSFHGENLTILNTMAGDNIWNCTATNIIRGITYLVQNQTQEFIVDTSINAADGLHVENMLTIVTFTLTSLFAVTLVL